MNNNTFEKLQYQSLKEKVKSYCCSGLGKNLIDKLMPSGDIKVIKRRLNETTEGRNLVDVYSHIPLEGIFNLDAVLTKVEKDGILDVSELITISNFLRGSRKIKAFLRDKEGYTPTLCDYSKSLYDLRDIEEVIETSVRGNSIDSNASKQLKKIRRKISDTEDKIKEALEKFLRNSSNKEGIQEFFISERNGRYTIPIKAQYKNKFKGTIVETSKRETTVFLEPDSVAKHSHNMIMLKSEESLEEYRILSEITELIYSNIRNLKINVEVIAELDMIFAKAKYSRAIDAIEPKVNNYGYSKIINGVYPLFEGKSVPLNFNIGSDFRTLIITGPNAGGKTVVLKTLGLITLAVQSGFHVKVDTGSEIAIFNRIFVDIGDDQSVENALSTFSSHVKNLAQILKESNNNSLVLLDEIGSGTDPSEGAGLAISILEELYKKGAITVATTHYGEIKDYSNNHSDFENAAMKFESNTLEPLYTLMIGAVGDSNALFIAKKMGISEKLIDKARLYIETKQYDYSLVKDSKVKKATKEEILENSKEEELEIGDRVILLDYNQVAIVHKPKDAMNNVEVFYNKEFIEVNTKRIKLDIKAKELYPSDYDMNSLFTEFKERKLERDIKRGSKKALKKIQKEIKEKR